MFSKNLRFLRKRENRSQEDIANLFQKKPNTVGNWENRKSEPSLTELMKLAEYFSVTTQDLLHRDLEGNPEPRSHSYISADTVSMVNEASPSADAFWVVLREIRVLQEKVDQLLSKTDTNTIFARSDKSNH